MSESQVWKAEQYDEKMGFVSEFGKNVVQLLQPVRGEQILDLGCGTGDLAHEISKSGAVVVGVDLSAEMIGRARMKYPHISFVVGNAEDLAGNEVYDAVFSNAALHWMKQADKVAASVWHVLKHGGRFVAELGGKGNVETVIRAMREVLATDYGIDITPLNPWYFPSIGEYSTLLEQQGFHVVYVHHFGRPTGMKDRQDGLTHWLKGFAGIFFQSLSDADKKAAFAKIELLTREALFRDGVWQLDYKRLQIVAIKP